MSIVAVQLGQCGNQIASEFFSTVVNNISSSDADDNEFCEETCERFFSRADTKDATLTARTVLLDMEPKVIAQARTTAAFSGRWEYPPVRTGESQQKRGSGNNWACGHCRYGPQESANISERIRIETEKCDRFSGFLTLLSLAGGTGSGLGAYVSELLRDEYPHNFQLAATVWPFDTGEVAVQGYNTLLTLAQLNSTSDALVALRNDDLNRACTRLLGARRVTFADINRLVGHKLGSFLLPVYADGGQRILANHLGELLEQLVSHPQYKMLTVRSIPLHSAAAKDYSSFEWHGLLKHLRQMLISGTPTEEGIDWQVKPSQRQSNRCLSSLAVLRGRGADSAETAGLRDASMYSRLLPRSQTFQCWTSVQPFNTYARSAVLLSNDRTSGVTVDRMLGKAWSMFASRAYVHQYLRYGLTEDDFLDSFAALEEVVASYERL